MALYPIDVCHMHRGQDDLYSRSSRNDYHYGKANAAKCVRCREDMRRRALSNDQSSGMACRSTSSCGRGLMLVVVSLRDSNFLFMIYTPNYDSMSNLLKLITCLWLIQSYGYPAERFALNTTCNSAESRFPFLKLFLSATNKVLI